jgi:hypothetical protein
MCEGAPGRLRAAYPTTYFKYQYLTYTDTALRGGLRATDLFLQG